MHWRSKVRPEDADAVRKLVGDTGFFSAEETDVAVELVDEALEKGAAVSGYEFMFAEDEGGAMQGYVCYGPIPATLSSYDLYWIAVAPAQQRAGLGGRLIRKAEKEAVSRGAEQMFVDTSGRAQYEPTRRFYERSGYTKAAVLDNFYGPNDAKVIYSRKLP